MERSDLNADPDPLPGSGNTADELGGLTPGPAADAAGQTAVSRPIALISDIHGNLDALQVVLKDIEQRQIRTIYCLGDIVGYGPSPRECLDLVIDRCAWSLMGNHDFAVLYEPTSFNSMAESAAFWTRRRLETEPDPELRRRRFEFLGSLEVRKWAHGAMFVHASPRRPINEYVFPDDVITNPAKMTAVFERFERRCFCGHTHITGVFTDEPDFYPPPDLKHQYRFNKREKCIVNPGSVGQPRDRDTRASYAVLHADRVEFVRLEYDVKAVIRRVKQIPELTDWIGERLLDGR